MNIKAIIFDLDGTALEAKYDALPTKEVIEAVRTAKRKVIVSAATGRPIADCRNILKKLEIVNPCIVSGGAAVINPIDEKVLWTKKISKEDVKKILDIAKLYPYEILFGEGTEDSKNKDKSTITEEKAIYIMNTDPENAKKIVSKINQIGSVVAHEAGSWNEGKLDIHVTHIEGTKKNALVEWSKLLNLKHDEIIAVGDRSNDLPLFEIAGFKVAVGNAVSELKEKADYIAPSVTENGLVDVINKFILKKI